MNYLRHLRYKLACWLYFKYAANGQRVYDSLSIADQMDVFNEVMMEIEADTLKDRIYQRIAYSDAEEVYDWLEMSRE